MILSTGGSYLASSGFRSCFGFFPSIWPVSTSVSPLVQKDLISFKNLLFTVQGWRSWWEAACLCAHTEPFEFRKKGSEAADKTQTLILLETQPWLEKVRVTTIQMQRSPVLGSQTHRRSASYSTQITSAIAFMFFLKWLYRFLGLPWRLSCNKSACRSGDMGSIPDSGRSPGEGNGNPLQYSCLGNPWTEEPSGLQSMGSQRARHNLVMKPPPHYYQSNL